MSSTCPACGAPVLAATGRGGQLLLDPEPTMTGVYQVSRYAGAASCSIAPLPSPGPLFNTHHCPTPKPTRARRTA